MRKEATNLQKVCFTSCRFHYLFRHSPETTVRNVLARNRTWSAAFAGPRANPEHFEDLCLCGLRRASPANRARGRKNFGFPVPCSFCCGTGRRRWGRQTGCWRAVGHGFVPVCDGPRTLRDLVSSVLKPAIGKWQTISVLFVTIPGNILVLGWQFVGDPSQSQRPVRIRTTRNPVSGEGSCTEPRHAARAQQLCQPKLPPRDTWLRWNFAALRSAAVWIFPAFRASSISLSIQACTCFLLGPIGSTAVERANCL